MPCAATPRGFTDTKLPWNDVIQNNPCGLKAVTSVGGVNVAAENLCPLHWQLKHGQQDWKPPIVIEP
jgi:hypothetical protein